MIVLLGAVGVRIYTKYPASYFQVRIHIERHLEDFERLRILFDKFQNFREVDLRFQHDLTIVPSSSNVDVTLDQSTKDAFVHSMTTLGLMSIKRAGKDVEFPMRIEMKLHRQFIVGAVYSTEISNALSEGLLRKCANIAISNVPNGQCVTWIRADWYAVYRWIDISNDD